jgi:hypothetical protein
MHRTLAHHTIGQQGFNAPPIKDRGCGSGRKSKSKPCEHWRRDYLQTVISLPEVLQDAWHQRDALAIVAICRSCRDVKVLFFASDAQDRDVPLTTRDIRDFLKGRAA